MGEVSLGGQRFVARQPILDSHNKVYGYELLFRNGLEDYFKADHDVAARSTLDSSLLFGLDTLCDQKRAFVNCTTDLLCRDLITLLPPNQTVVEILEIVEPEGRVVGACRQLKKAGYEIALDDFAPNDPREPLVEYSDILKVDVRATSVEERSEMVRKYESRCRLLAEKVETQPEFREAREMGFQYFQGYFFRRPETMIAREMPASRIHHLRLLEMVCRDELDMRELERSIKMEASICYRLLRYLNSPRFGLSLEIKSVRHAMAILGERELRRWVRLVVTIGMAEQRCSELVLMGLARARFCELLSPKMRTKNDLFLLGLLSVMDAILEMPLERILAQVPVDHDTKSALSGQASPLRPIYRLMLAQESGEWEEARGLATQLRLTDEEASELWWQAMQWAQKVTEGV